MIQGAHEVELTGVEREVVQVAWLLCVRVLAQAGNEVHCTDLENEVIDKMKVKVPADLLLITAILMIQVAEKKMVVLSVTETAASLRCSKRKDNGNKI